MFMMRFHHSRASVCHIYCLLLQCDSTLSESSINDIRRKVQEAIAVNKIIYNLNFPVSLLLCVQC